MNDYIKREDVIKALENEGKENQKWAGLPETINLCTDFSQAINVINTIPPSDVRPVEEGENITENNPVDEFVCSKCGIILEDWSRVEIDEDDGERTNYEYVFRFCPNCGVKLKGVRNG